MLSEKLFGLFLVQLLIVTGLPFGMGRYVRVMESCNNKCAGEFDMCNQLTKDMADVFECMIDQKVCNHQCNKRRNKKFLRKFSLYFRNFDSF